MHNCGCIACITHSRTTILGSNEGLNMNFNPVTCGPPTQKRMLKNVDFPHILKFLYFPHRMHGMQVEKSSHNLMLQM